MSWKNYFRDNRLLLLIFFLALAFISIIIWLDPNMHIHLSNLLYLLFILTLLFSLFFLYDYRKKKEFYRELKEKIEGGYILEPSQKSKSEEKLFIELLNTHKQQYEQKIESIKKEQKEFHEYLTSWVHEIKTPISVTKMMIETDQLSSSLEEEIGKIDHLVEQALYYNRTSDFSKDYFIQEIDVEQIIKEAIKGNRKLFLSKKIRIQLDLTSLEVLTDKKGLLFIVNQFLSNSLKYTPGGGEISVHIQQNERRIIIRDNGMGVPSEDLPRVFQKGFTGKNGRQVAASTGMGLYLANKIATKLGHQLSIHSREGSYTEASIYFSKTVDLLREEYSHR
ncbi:sensor histidine kinase [Lederbergia wuyishanensis]|uniref:histidine kinase n=1 Tax=Lederbergia wuyishanensis TaxID=1347903 RepID=A0ABU0D303_9BACI|nr:sensor histidine kinase [Lederbergia wuyishanensis]MCJ8007071.1 sensor histidine kinase [Lederbergia wuyishanensis]MDQ0342785.1 signal transduction histidine kinase [Lederbergia wuyishanensis]